MLFRPVTLVTVLGAAVAAPYVFTNSSDLGAKVKSLWSSSTGSNGSNVAATDGVIVEVDEIAAAKSPSGPGSLLFPTTTPIEGFRVQRFDEVFRMDVTQDWVYSRWSRKSTSVAHDEWFGVRVPLVTGTRIDDLAGSLTYYFDGAGVVQHIKFHGRTGDTRRLVGLMTRVYEFEPQPPTAPGEQLYQVRWGNYVKSELRTTPAPVLWSSAPHSSYTVELELARPGTNRFLPPRPIEYAPQASVTPKNAGLVAGP